jgi:hypothetical protein
MTNIQEKIAKIKKIMISWLKGRSLRQLSDSAFITLFCIGALFMIFIIHPRFTTQLFEFQRSQEVTRFFKSVMKEKGINAREYWKFREFYSPGVFTYDPHVIKLAETQTLAPDHPLCGITPLFFFHSRQLVSTDSIVSKILFTKGEQTSSFLLIIAGEDPASENILYRDDTQLIYLHDSSTIRIVFMKSLEEMKKTNGFFDYTTGDMKFFQDQAWINKTDITLSNAKHVTKDVIKFGQKLNEKK